MSGAIQADGGALDRTVEIPGGALSDSLEQLARQLGIQILFDADRLKGVKAVAVSGHLSPQEAIDKLLIGTSLEVYEKASDSFLITSRPSVSTSRPPTQSRLETAPNSELDEINVTGTHIRGETPIGASLSTYDRQDFDRLGSATVPSLARYMLENFSGADSLATLNTNGNVGSIQQGAAANIFGGAGLDLLGLGSGATLTLIDGHRVAPGGLDGGIVDVSLIPMSAIDHVEVMTDGASAIYGSDAIAGVVNIVTRRALEGAETSIRYGRSTQGGADEFTGSQTLGHAWSDGNVFLDYEYDDQGGLDASERHWIGPENGPYSLIPESHRHSFFLSSAQILDQTELAFRGLYSSRGFQLNGLQLNPSGFVPISETGDGYADLGWAVVSADRDLPAAWHVSSSAMYSNMNQRRSGEGFPDGLAGAHFDNALVADSNLAGVDLSASGRLLSLPAGALKAALGGGYRSESFRGSVPSITPLPTVSANRTDVDSYVEVTVPVLGDQFSFPGARRFDVSFAYRTDRYSQFGNTSNAKWGWAWEPTHGLTIRGTQGTSFKAPLISQLDATTTAYTALFPSSTPGGAPVDALVINGAGQYLLPEKSREFTAGIDWAPIRWPQIRGSINYFNINYTNRIQSQNIDGAPLDAQPQLYSVTTFNPSLAQVLPYFQAPGFQKDGAGLGPAGVTAIVANLYANAEMTVEQGVRLNGQYTYDVGELGQFGLEFATSYLLENRTTLASGLPDSTNVTNTIAELPKFRARAGLTWQYHSVNAEFRLNHTGVYQNTLFSPARDIASWTTEDLTLKVEIPSHVTSPWHDLTLVLNVQNLTDRRPPYLSIPAGDIAVGRSAVPFDGTNASAVGRYISLEIRKRWQ